MKHWPLGAKLAVWSVLVVLIALSVSVLSARARVRAEEIEELDEELGHDAEHLLEQFRLHGSRLDWVNVDDIKEVTPSSQSSARFLIIADKVGRILYRSGPQPWDLLLQSPVGASTTKIRGKEVRVLKDSAGQEFTYCFVADTAEIDSLIDELMRANLVTLPVALFVAVLGGWWLARQALRPIKRIADAADSIRPEDLSTRLESLSQRDDIGRLVSVFNRMLERLERGFRQATRFSADASHELRTPLTVLHSSLADLINDESLSDKHREIVADLQLQTLGLISTANTLLLLARADAGRLQLTLEQADFAKIVTECVEDARIMADHKSIEIECPPLPPALARLDVVSTRQILANLLDNAMKYNAMGGRVLVEFLLEKQQICLRISNTGQGISDEARRHLFKRFFREEHHEDVPGAGLGLSLARELARGQGGDLILLKNVAGWTEFELRLPAEADLASKFLSPAKVESVRASVLDPHRQTPATDPRSSE